MRAKAIFWKEGEQVWGVVYDLKIQAHPRQSFSPGERSGSLHTFQGSSGMLLWEPPAWGVLAGEWPLIRCKPHQTGGSADPHAEAG